MNKQQQSLLFRGRSDIPSEGFTLDSRELPHFVGEVRFTACSVHPYPRHPALWRQETTSWIKADLRN